MNLTPEKIAELRALAEKAASRGNTPLIMSDGDSFAFCNAACDPQTIIALCDLAARYGELPTPPSRQEAVACWMNPLALTELAKVERMASANVWNQCVGPATLALFTAPPALCDVVRDAARYRWLREENGASIHLEVPDDDGDMTYVGGWEPHEIDAHIDAAIAADPSAAVGLEGK